MLYEVITLGPQHRQMAFDPMIRLPRRLQLPQVDRRFARGGDDPAQRLHRLLDTLLTGPAQIAEPGQTVAEQRVERTAGDRFLV